MLNQKSVILKGVVLEIVHGDYNILTQQDNVSYTSNFANFRHCKMVDPLITHILGKNQEFLCFFDICRSQKLQNHIKIRH